MQYDRTLWKITATVFKSTMGMHAIKFCKRLPTLWLYSTYTVRFCFFKNLQMLTYRVILYKLIYFVKKETFFCKSGFVLNIWQGPTTRSINKNSSCVLLRVYTRSMSGVHLRQVYIYKGKISICKVYFRKFRIYYLGAIYVYIIAEYLFLLCDNFPGVIFSYIKFLVIFTIF